MTKQDNRARIGRALMTAGLSGWTAHELSVYLLPILNDLAEQRVLTTRGQMWALASELEGESEDWSNDPAAMGAKADAAKRIREALR